MTTNIKAGSLLARATQDRDERVQELTLELPIPTWDKNLLWGFQCRERSWLEEKLSNIQRSKRTTRDLETDVDLLIEATDSFWLYDPGKSIGGRRLGPDPQTRQMRDDYVRIEDSQDLAEALEAKIDNGSLLAPSTQLVLWLFRGNGSAIGSFAGRLVIWMQNTDIDVSKVTLGE
jgi:hypothetical protein